MKRENIIVTVSGGRTSAYMAWWLKEYMSNLYNFTFIYANTGLEHEKTLEFVDRVDKYLKLNLIWVEAIINKKHGIGTTYKVVNFNTACRDNRIFMDMCEVYGVPNQEFIHCTRELKNIPIKKWADNHIKGDYRLALGIRHDELHRVKIRRDAIYPLSNIGKFTKEQILEWWKEQPFDLEIEEHYGNCVGCYKKNHRKLKMIADENPSYFDPFIEMENAYSFVKSISEHEERKIYRYNRTAYEVKHNIKYPDTEEYIEGCAEECGSIISDYISAPIERTLFNV